MLSLFSFLCQTFGTYVKNNPFSAQNVGFVTRIKVAIAALKIETIKHFWFLLEIGFVFALLFLL